MVISMPFTELKNHALYLRYIHSMMAEMANFLAKNDPKNGRFLLIKIKIFHLLDVLATKMSIYLFSLEKNSYIDIWGDSLVFHKKL